MEDLPLDPARMGRVIHAAGAEVLRFERALPTPAIDVWDAFTTPERTASWWGRRTGASAPPNATVTVDGLPAGEVLAWERARVLELAFDAPDGRWHLCVMLDPLDGGTLLTLDHLAPHPRDPDIAAFWHWHLDRLDEHLVGEDAPAAEPDAHLEELQRLYAQAGG